MIHIFSFTAMDIMAGLKRTLTPAATLPTTSARGGRRPTARRRICTEQQALTTLCGLITILVLRGTIGISFLSPSGPQAPPLHASEPDRVVADIRSDKLDDYATTALPNDTAPYSLGPKIADWDDSRQKWLVENPGFPSHGPDGKPRVLLVTGSQPSPCRNPIGDHYLLKSVKNKIDYCRLHSIEITYSMAHLDHRLSGYWSKLPLIRRLMLSHPEIEWIWWMDSDAFFTDMLFEIPILKYDRAGFNLVAHGYRNLLLNENSWIALNTGSFLIRNCQWALDLLDEWAQMGPNGPARNRAGEILTARLKDRPKFEADDQSALIYLLVTRKDKWMDKVFLENSYYLHGYWAGLVDRYERLMELYGPGYGDERWPFVTHFVGCKPCGGYGDYSFERCVRSMERAFNFADNKVLGFYGYGHRGLSSPNVKRKRNETDRPLDSIDQFSLRGSSVLGGENVSESEN